MHALRYAVLLGTITTLAMSATVEYQVGNTTITGVVKEAGGEQVHIFQGVPFAKPPVGDLRFKPPQPIKLNDRASFSAVSNFPDCAQPIIKAELQPNNVSEDCLYLIMWIPEKVRERYVKDKLATPVVFLVYGGGFSGGSATGFMNQGIMLSAKEQVIVVGANYRVGAFGFMDFNIDDVPGNMGLMDQQAALKWVKEHIHEFGGDPNQITMMGCSAGSVSISGHILNNESRPLFQNALMDGGVILEMAESMEESKKRGLTIAKQLGCNIDGTIDKVAECLRGQRADDIVNATLSSAKSWVIQFRPTYGSRFLPKPPAELLASIKNPLPRILLGTAKEEGTFFTTKENPFLNPEPLNLTDAVSAEKQIEQVKDSFNLNPSGSSKAYAEKLLKGVEEFVADGLFVCPVLKFTDKISQAGARVYLYEMDYFTKIPFFLPVRPHAHHGMGYLYELGTPLLMPKVNLTEHEKSTIEKIMGMAGSLVKTSSDVSPTLGPESLETYITSRRYVNIITEDGKLRVASSHDRDKYCEDTWGYTVPRGSQAH